MNALRRHLRSAMIGVKMPDPAATPVATKWPHLANAPIVEAVLDIRTTVPDHVPLEQLARIGEAVRDRYPHTQQRKRWRAELALREGDIQAARATGGPIGYWFTSADRLQVLQTRRDGFTLSRLRPYHSWAEFRQEAREHWGRFVSAAEPGAITRLALRYINRLELPLPFADFAEFILTRPEVAPTLPQGLQGFFMRLQLPDDESPAMAIVSETFEPPENDKLPLILDIDAIRMENYEPTSEEVWLAFDQLADFKNRVFFKTITPRVVEMYR